MRNVRRTGKLRREKRYLKECGACRYKVGVLSMWDVGLQGLSDCAEMAEVNWRGDIDV